MWSSLLLGTGMLLVSIIIYGMVAALIVQLVAWLIRTGYNGSGFWKNVAVMTLVTLVTATAHLIQITMWAVAFLMIGEISAFEKALYFSGENYTSLGYGDIVLSEQWRLLGPLEAINGVLLFGLSTAVMFGVMSHLIANHLRFQLGHLGETALNLKPPPAVGGSEFKGANESL
jgi:Ion channel